HSMIENPIVSTIVRDDFRVMSRTSKRFISMNQDLVMIFHHRSSLFVGVRAEQAVRTAYNCSIGTSQSLPTTPYRGKQIIIIAPFMDVSTFVGGSGNLSFFGSVPNR